MESTDTGQRSDKGVVRGKSIEGVDESADDERTFYHDNAVKTKGKLDVEDDERTKSYKMAIIRKLLREFNLDETLDKYRNDRHQTFTVDEKEFSSDCSSSAFELKKRLMHLMGTNVVRVNDTRYHDELRRRMWEEYQAQLDKEEKDREEAELTRMRRLLKSGLISTEEMKQDPIMYGEYKRLKEKYGGRHKLQKRQGSPRRRPKSRPSTTQTTCSQHSSSIWPTNSNDTSVPQSDRQSEPRRRYRPKTSPEGKRVRDSDTDHTNDDAVVDQGEENDQDRDELRLDNGDLEADERPVSSTLYNDPLLTERATFVDPLLVELTKQKTVDDLYRMAEVILDGKLPSQQKMVVSNRK